MTTLEKLTTKKAFRLNHERKEMIQAMHDYLDRLQSHYPPMAECDDHQSTEIIHVMTAIVALRAITNNNK